MYIVNVKHCFIAKNINLCTLNEKNEISLQEYLIQIAKFTKKLRYNNFDGSSNYEFNI